MSQLYDQSILVGYPARHHRILAVVECCTQFGYSRLDCQGRCCNVCLWSCDMTSLLSRDLFHLLYIVFCELRAMLQAAEAKLLAFDGVVTK